MKNKYLITSILFLAILFIVFAYEARTNEIGAASGFTGAPTDMGTCATVSCHPGIAVDVSSSYYLESTIPSSGFSVDSTYTFTLKFNKLGATRFGFQITALDENNDFSGNLLLISTDSTQYGVQQYYINHTLLSSFANDSSQWRFRWKAPPFTTQVKFYASIVAGSTVQNDQTFSLRQDYFSFGSGLNEQDENKFALNIYPNPTSKDLFIKFAAPYADTYTYYLTDINGKMITKKKNINFGKGISEFKLTEINELVSGIYFLVLKGKKLSRVEQIMKF